MNPEQKSAEHAAAMVARQRPSGAQHIEGIAPSHRILKRANPFQPHLDDLVAFFAARWPEQVHFHTGWVANPRRAPSIAFEGLEVAVREEIAKLDPPYRREEYLPRQPLLEAQTWVWGVEIGDAELQDSYESPAQWESFAIVMLCLHAEHAPLTWGSPLAKPRLYWRRMPEVRTEYLGEVGVHRIYLNFRCALEGSAARGNPDRGAAIFI